MQRFNSEVQELTDFLTNIEWPFFANPVVNPMLYAAIYDDWKTGKITPIQIDEVPY